LYAFLTAKAKPGQAAALDRSPAKIDDRAFLNYKNRTAKVAKKGPRRQKIRKLGALDEPWLLGDRETVALRKP
jgi:hypothetical protein